MRVSKQQKEEIRNRILIVSKELFNELGFDNTTTSIIAKKANIAEGTIYNYFTSKTEIFIEIMTKDFIVEEYTTQSLKISDQLYDFIVNYLKRILFIPKNILKEVMIASLNLAKKKPNLMKKLAEMDLKFIDDFEKKLKELKEKNYIEENCDVKQLSEIIFGFIAFEVTMYLYEKDRKKDYMYEQIKIKLEVLLKHYIKED